MTKDQLNATYIVDRYASHFMGSKYCIDKARMLKVKPMERLTLGYLMARNSTIGSVSDRALFIIENVPELKSKFVAAFGKGEKTFTTALNGLIKRGIVEYEEFTNTYSISPKCFDITELDNQYIAFNNVLEDILF